jgi:hypothetical protein
MKSLYSMKVTDASAGPFIQSLSVTGGKIDCSVGPGVGRGLTTVQPGGAPVLIALACVGVLVAAVTGLAEGDGRTAAWLVVVDVDGLAWQAAKTRVNNRSRVKKRLKLVSPRSVLPAGWHLIVP